MNEIEKASAAKTLADDETFKEVMQEVRDKQVAVFMKSNSSLDDREKAHSVIRGLNSIAGHIARLMRAGDVEKFKQEKDQHRDG